MKDLDTFFQLPETGNRKQEDQTQELPFIPNLNLDLFPASEKPTPYLLGLLIRSAIYKIDNFLLQDIETYLQDSTFKPQDFSPFNLPICLVSLDPSKIRTHMRDLKQTHYKKIINLILILIKDEFQNPENLQENQTSYPITFSIINQPK